MTFHLNEIWCATQCGSILITLHFFCSSFFAVLPPFHLKIWWPMKSGNFRQKLNEFFFFYYWKSKQKPNVYLWIWFYYLKRWFHFFPIANANNHQINIEVVLSPTFLWRLYVILDGNVWLTYTLYYNNSRCALSIRLLESSPTSIENLLKKRETNLNKKPKRN